ncbi:hypothetical protein, partial [uncultured Acetatifactor sp.]|uniref:hypothetical protein n=1 Tax=uncultured Acetatifactor sp. TaxID=1671927 RepID=UPI00272C3716
MLVLARTSSADYPGIEASVHRFSGTYTVVWNIVHIQTARHVPVVPADGRSGGHHSCSARYTDTRFWMRAATS